VGCVLALVRLRVLSGTCWDPLAQLDAIGTWTVPLPNGWTLDRLGDRSAQGAPQSNRKSLNPQVPSPS
jgi:hypothetical protein